MPKQANPMQPTEEDYRLFFGRNHEYYFDKLLKYQQGTKITFNLAAMFFGINWMLYRKMYLQTLILALAFSLMLWLQPVVVEYFHLSPQDAATLQLVCQFAVLMVIGFLGNYMYLRHSMRKVHNIVNSSNDEDEVIANLTQSGGITLTFHICLAIFVILMLLMM